MNKQLKFLKPRCLVLMLVISMLIIQSCSLALPFQKRQNNTQSGVQEATPVVEAVPTLTPTPLPTVRIENAEYKIFIGDYLDALNDYQNVLAESSDALLQAQANLGIGRVYYLLKDYSNAIKTLEALIVSQTDSFSIANAYYFLGLCYRDTQRYADASAALIIFNNLRPGVLDATIQEMRGDILRKGKMYEPAIEAYQKAIEASADEDTTALQINIGKIYAEQNDHINAIRTYDAVFQSTTDDYTKAQMNFLMGVSYTALGELDQAYRVYQESVLNYPKSYDTYSGLVELINNNITVDNLSRGIVDYYAGQYGVAIDILDRYMDENPQHDGTPLFYKALCLIETGQQTAAIALYDQIIEQYPNSRFWENAWDEKSYTQWVYLDQYTEAANTLIQYVSLVPDSANAPQYLYDAGRILERSSQLEQAASVWGGMMDQYPSAPESYRALFLTGILHYRLGNYNDAKVNFQRYLVLSGSIEDSSSAYFWIGKCENILGNTNEAQQAWQQSAQIDPTGYYSERSLEIIDSIEPMKSGGEIDLNVDLVTEKRIAEEWLHTTFSISNDIDLSQPGELAYDDNYRRGDQFWEIGMYEKAVEQFNLVYERYKSDPAQNFRLMNHLLDLYLYRPAVFISRNILDLANFTESETLTAPSYFNHIRFGTYYKDIVLASAAEYNLDPIFLFSMMRQESLFEGFVDSSAGAAGLMQVMPATGDEIYGQLSWPAYYTSSDLYRPIINIRYGAYYMSRQITSFDGNLIAALASYNGGAGNTLAWEEFAQDDPDLLLEIIRFDETRTYIFNIAENYHIYNRLYQKQ
jgi:soluble lytic murein transglycosylase